MYKSDLDKILNSSFGLNAICLYGQCDFFIDFYLDAILQTIKTLKGEIDTKSLYFEEYNLDDAYGFLAQPSLFATTNVLIIKTNASIKKEDLKALIAISIQTKNFLIVQLYSNQITPFDKQKKVIDTITKTFLLKSFNNQANVVRFFMPFLSEAINILKLQAQKIGLDITPKAITYLYNVQHHHLELAIGELSKLKLLSRPIDVSEVESFSATLSLSEMEDIYSDFLNQKAFLKTLKKIMDFGSFNEQDFLRGFGEFIYGLILFQLFIKENGFFNSKQILGFQLPKNIEQTRAKLAIKYKLPLYANLLHAINKLALELKTKNKINPKTRLYGTLTNMQQALMRR